MRCDERPQAVPASSAPQVSRPPADGRPAPGVAIALHGPFGEGGTIQALLEAAGLAYTGSGVAASAIGPQAERPDLLAAVREQLSDWFGEEWVDGWRHLETKRIDHALPDFQPGRFEPGGRSPKLDSGLFVCGDYRESPSIQGALVSGRKAAEAVVRTVAAPVAA